VRKKKLLSIIGSVCLILALVALLFPGCGAAEEEPGDEFEFPPIIGISASEVGTAGHTCVTAYAPPMEDYLGVPVRIIPGATTGSNLERIKRGTASFCGGGRSVTSVTAAIEATDEFATWEWGPQEIGLVWYAGNIPYAVMVRTDSDIQTLQDLKGKKISSYLGAPGWEQGFMGMLAFAGLERSDVIEEVCSSYTTHVRAFIEGRVDACWCSPISTVTYEAEAVPGGIRWIPMPLEDTEAWARYFEICPTKGNGIMSSGVESAHGVPGQIGDMCMASYYDVDDELIAQICEALVETWPEYQSAHDQLRQQSMDGMREFLNRSAIPVHPGTIKYLRGEGVWTDDDDVWNQELKDKQYDYIDAWQDCLVTAEGRGLEPVLDNEAFQALWKSMSRDVFGLFKTRT
jgi:hypothetical protein